MRVSSSTIFESGLNAIQNQTASLLKTQQQIATGRRILTPADDPIAAGRALELMQAAAVNKQHTQTNTIAAKNTLQLEEATLSNVTQVLQNFRELAVRSGNPTLSNSDRQALAAEAQARYQELLGLSNTTDGSGQYLFSGYQGNTLPFTQTSGAAVYAGDQGVRQIQIGASRQLPVSHHGAEVFQPGTTDDPFLTISNFVTALQSGTFSTSDLNAALGGTDNAMARVLRVRADIGARLNEIDAAIATGGSFDIEYQQTLSDLQDLDYAEAITRLDRQRTTLEAAQKSYLAVSNLSLFQFI